MTGGQAALHELGAGLCCLDNVDEMDEGDEVLKKKEAPVLRALVLRASVGPPTAMNDLRLL